MGFAGVGDVTTGTPRSTLTGPTYAPQHRWVFMSDQRPDEAWLFKQYDTRPGVARQCFHNSFHDPFHDEDPDCPGRRSAEFRILLIFPKVKATSSSEATSKL